MAQFKKLIKTFDPVHLQILWQQKHNHSRAFDKTLVAHHLINASKACTERVEVENSSRVFGKITII